MNSYTSLLGSVAMAIAYAAPDSSRAIAKTDELPSPTSIQGLNNYNLKWDGNPFGLEVRYDGPARIYKSRLTAAMVPELVAALRDPDRFAIAHVMLAEFAGGVDSGGVSHWHGMRIALHANGKAEWFPEDRSALIVRWEKWAGYRP